MAASTSTSWTYSSKTNPCPICSRITDGDCRMSRDGERVICHHPKDHKPGTVIDGWAFTANTADGRASHWVLDQSKPDGRKMVPFKPKAAAPQTPPPARISGPIHLSLLPEPAPAPGRRQSRAVYSYSSTQQARRTPKPDGGKVVSPWHHDGTEWVNSAGPDHWPAYREAEALAADGWVLELEGEPCCDWARAGGAVAISQPGHKHTTQAIRPRYARLKAAGVAGVVFVSDNDAEGLKRARDSEDAAALEGLPFLHLPAVDVWPGIPEKGSIDDAPGTPAERVAAIEAAASQALPRAQRTAPETDRARLTAAITDGASTTDLAELVNSMAAESGQSPQALQRMVEAINHEQQQRESVKAEKASIRAEADRRDIGRALTLDYLLPPEIADALRVRSKALPVDDVAAAVTFLVAVSGLVKLGTRVVASRSADYRVPINLYAALVARSGAKKSPVSRLLVNAPSAELRQELAREHHRSTEEWKASNKGAKTADRTDPPKAAYLQVSDATAEALAAQLQQQEARGLGMLLHRDELAGLFGSLNQYRGGHGADEELFLEAFDGSGLHSLRIATAGGGRFYNRCHLSIWGTIQPAVLTELVAGGDASGLWARFVFVPLPERVVPLGNDTEAEQRASTAAAATLATAARSIYTLPKTEHLLSPEAFASFSRYEARCQGEALRAVIPAQSALYGKAAGKVLRIAGLIHLLGKVTGEADAEISPGTIDRAVALVDHLNGWALSLHADIANGGASDLMRKIHKIAEAANVSIQWRDVSVRLTPSQRKGKEIDSDAFAAAVDALADLGVGEVTRSERGKPVYRALHPLP